jgi:type IV pilus assembly protein PilW
MRVQKTNLGEALGTKAGSMRGPLRLRQIASRGMTLVELLVAVALGMMVLTALIALYGNVSRTNHEMAKTNQLIENGRFAMQLLQDDVALAGFWGSIDSLSATAVPNPCLASANWPADPAQLAEYKSNLMSVPVQGYADASALAACGVTGVVAKSDVLVVRHANACVAGAGCDGGSDTGPHLQVSACRTDAPPEPAYLVEVPAVLDARPVRLRAKDCATEVPRRKMVVNIYYVANGATGVPTLMRVTFNNGAFSAPQALVDGIEAFRVEYGVDSLGSNGLAITDTNLPDGNADTYVSCPAAGCALADLGNVVSVKLYLLSRNLEPTGGHVDSKSYALGPLAVAASNDSYKRHAFSTTVRLVNPSSRRETP